jgi:hypothetical protein
MTPLGLMQLGLRLRARDLVKRKNGRAETTALDTDHRSRKYGLKRGFLGKSKKTRLKSGPSHPLIAPKSAAVHSCCCRYDNLRVGTFG